MSIYGGLEPGRGKMTVFLQRLVSLRRKRSGVRS